MYLADGSKEIRFGTVRYNADGSFTLISDAGEEFAARVLDKRGSFMVGDEKYTRYDNSEDMTLALTEDFYGTPLYYYTVKTDGYGNMYILDEHDDGIQNVYLGTYDDYDSFVQNGSNYYELKFTGYLLDEDGGACRRGAELVGPVRFRHPAVLFRRGFGLLLVRQPRGDL